MEKGRNLVPSGIEPVDKLRGGLESGRLYLVHGEGPSKSLFGYQFLMEGLKHGEQVALIISYSPEDAVRWFARLGYDCLEDIYSGRLVVLECAEENFDQIARMKELTPVLRELRWLIGEKNPKRVVFEPIGRLVMGEHGATGARSTEFAAWASDIGSTSLLIANGRSEELITNLLPLVKESFRFELKQEDDLAIRYLFFEKSPDIPGQAIEADPSKGIFLVERPSKKILPAQPMAEKAPGDGPGRAGEADTERDPFTELISELFAGVEDEAESTAWLQEPIREVEPAHTGMTEGPAGPAYAVYRPDQTRVSSTGEGSEEGGTHPATGPQQDELERLEIGGVVEDLLKPPATVAGVGRASTTTEPEETTPAIEEEAAEPVDDGATEGQHRRVKPEDFNVLMIADDPRSAQRIVKSLSEYYVEEAADGVSGLAKLISFKPDLVVLDVDLKAVDGFEMLKHIRSNLDVPIIALSSSRLRASDRIKSAELGADYYLTKPFSSRELRQKARQLIGRYRRIDEWITGAAQPLEALTQSPGRRTPEPPGTDERRGFSGDMRTGGAQDARQAVGAAGFAERILDSGRRRSGQGTEPDREAESDRASMLPYSEFVRRIEEMVEVTMDGDAWFSVVGCRLNHSSEGHASSWTSALAELVPDLIRNCDIASVNEAGDLMILLTDADPTGAKAFTTRLQETVQNKFKADPVVWVRTFPFSDQQDE
jgi:CheY-like chemotaxis protein/KaiC/GvpD/RAD55 family RecA-like ATPase